MTIYQKQSLRGVAWLQLKLEIIETLYLLSALNEPVQMDFKKACSVVEQAWVSTFCWHIINIFKGYLCCKTFFGSAWCVINDFFLFEERIMFHYWDIEIFVFLWNPQISKSVTPSLALLHNGSYSYAYFFWILRIIKMKFDQILLCCMKNILTCLWLSPGDWKLVSDPFIILLKWQYREIWPFLIFDIYRF